MVISELLALNEKTLVDGDGDSPDWIEIQSLAEEPLSLDGWFLTDDPEEPRKWRFPAVMLAPDEFLLVFASGKDRTAPDAGLHTNFKLSAKGEYLALVQPDGETVAHRYSEFPAQRVDVSYGVDRDGELAFFVAPSPGRTNSEGLRGVLAQPTCEPSRGFYEAPFRVELMAGPSGGELFYTLDGSTPSREHGRAYRGPIAVETTTVLRARAFKEGFLTGPTATHTYVFVRDVAKQGNTPPGYPSTWTAKKGPLPADYEMDPEIAAHPSYAAVLDDSLLAVPTISLVTEIGNLFDPERGIYQHTKMHGMEWERPVSVEWLDPDGREGFQTDAGIRIQGGSSRTPRKSPKHSFRLAFRKIYGPARLRFPIFQDGRAVEEFDTLILRAEFNQSWIHHNSGMGNQRARGQFVRDQWMKDSQRAMGHPSPHATYAHLYVNGLYWGLYSPNERANAEFGAAYEGGDADEYDATNSGNLIDGSLKAYDAVFRLAEGATEENSVYQALREWVDIDSFIDYMILNQYAGNRDRDSHNWYSIHRRDGGGLQYISWDAESIFIRKDDNRLSLDEARAPSGLFRRLMRNRQFARRFADRAHRHLTGDGLLTPERVKERWERRARQVFDAVVAESARWGDYRRDVDPRGEPPELLERDVQWVEERRRVLEEVVPERTALVLEQYRKQGYYPSVEAPRLSQYGGTIPADFEVLVSAPRGQVYYTLDGTDPLGADGRSSAAALQIDAAGARVRLRATTHVRARAVFDEEWSALTEALFSRSAGLRVSEVMFHSSNRSPHPAAGNSATGNSATGNSAAPTSAAPNPERDSQAEDHKVDFLELTNVSGHTLDLAGVRVAGAVEFTFAPEGQPRLEPGGVLVLVDDITAFEKRYGASTARVVGEYDGRLSNSGETLTIFGAGGETILRFAYKDHWYPVTDGRGASLVVVDPKADPAAWSLREMWRPSQVSGGSPGRVEGPNRARPERS